MATANVNRSALDCGLKFGPMLPIKFPNGERVTLSMKTALPSAGSSAKDGESGQYCGTRAPAPSINARAVSIRVAGEPAAKLPARSVINPVRSARVAAARSAAESESSPLIEYRARTNSTAITSCCAAVEMLVTLIVQLPGAGSVIVAPVFFSEGNPIAEGASIGIV